jgi:hypothetical protein
MRFNELLNEDKKLSEAVPKSKGANAFGQMATSLSKEKPNTMANAPVSATNKAKPGNPNTPNFGKGTAMPTKPFQTPGAGTTPAPKASAPTSTTTPKASAPTSTTTPKADEPTTTPADPVAQGAATSPGEPEKPGMMYKMGKGIGDFGRGFKIGYGGRMPTDSDVVPDEEPGSANKAGGDSAAAVATQGKETSDYSRIKANVDKLDKKGKQRILGILQKELGITTKTVTPEPGTSAMASMAGQLAGTKPQSTTPTPSSTGGQTTKTATGVRHTAKPSNVPQPASTAPTVTPATKPTRTGGRKPGQLSSTPNAVRKRTARAAARGVQNSSIQRSGNLIAEGFTIFRKK